MKKWIIAKRQKDDLVEQILLNRKIQEDDWPTFLKPDFSKLYDPYLMCGIKEAVTRIKQAVKAKEIIGIFADYDADGIPAAAMLSDILEHKLKVKTAIYIPSRSEGYGLSEFGLNFLKKSGAKLVITADLGIRDIERTEFAKKFGLEIIITDHHEPGDVLPRSLALINPKLKDSKYPFRELSGGGVIFKLIQALSKEFPQIEEGDLKWLMDLLGITTICDVVPLISENRVFAKFGLVVLQKTKRLGLKKLYEVSAIDPKKIDSYQVGFQIGPRINAPGRMDKPSESLLLLKSNDAEEATKLALHLDAINRERQVKLDTILKEAEEEIIKEKLCENKVILLARPGWSSGLIGLVAGKILEKYNRPTVILEKGELYSKGSARSIDNFNIIEVLEKVSPILKTYGGHAKAAGLTVENRKVKQLYYELLNLAEEKLTADDLTPKMKIDALVSTKDLSLELFDKIKELEPFGLGNPRPIFALENVEAKNLRAIGADAKHLKFKIDDIDAIGFGNGAMIKDLTGPIDIAFTLDEDCWNGSRKLQLKIVDIKI